MGRNGDCLKDVSCQFLMSFHVNLKLSESWHDMSSGFDRGCSCSWGTSEERARHSETEKLWRLEVSWWFHVSTSEMKVTKVTAYSRFWLFLSVSLHQHLAFKAMATDGRMPGICLAGRPVISGVFACFCPQCKVPHNAKCNRQVQIRKVQVMFRTRGNHPLSSLSIPVHMSCSWKWRLKSKSFSSFFRDFLPFLYDVFLSCCVAIAKRISVAFYDVYSCRSCSPSLMTTTKLAGGLSDETKLSDA